MKNKTVNKKVIKAISIGLSAMMAMQPVLATPVLAEELGGDDSTPVEAKNYNEDNDHASDTANESRKAVDDAKAPVETVTSDVQSSVKAGEAGTTEIKNDNGEVVDTVDNAQAVINATSIPVYDENGNLLNEEHLLPEVLQEISDSLALTDVALTSAEAAKEHWANNKYQNFGTGYSEATKANEAVAAADNAIAAEKTANDNITKAVNAENDAADNAASAYSDGVKAVEDADKDVKATEEKYTELVSNIANATSISAATAAYDELGQLLNDTKTSLDEKQTALDKAKEALASFVDKYTDAEKDAKDAKDAYDKAKKDYYDAKAKYDKWTGNYNDKVNTIKKFNDAYELAKSNLDAAEKNLEIVSEKAEALNQAVNTAKTAVMTDNAAAMDIVAKIELAQATEARVWDEEDALFESIMKNYYLPKIGAKEVVSMQWNHKTGVDKANKSFDNDKYNYCIVVYKDADGNESEPKYFNYVMEKGSNDSILIFEKAVNEVVANQALANNKDSLLYNDGVEVDSYSVGGNSLSKADLQDGIKDKTIKQINGIYYKQGDITDTIPAVTYNEETGVVSNTETENEKTVVKIDKTTVKGTFDTTEDGDVVEVFKGTETTIVYHKESLSSGADGSGYYTFNDEKAASDALDEAKKAVGSDDILIEAKTVSETHKENYEDTESVTEEVDVNVYQASTEYVSSFAKTIDLSSNEYTIGLFGAIGGAFGGNGCYDEDEAIERAENDIRKKMLKADEFDSEGNYILSVGGVENSKVNGDEFLWGNDAFIDVLGSVQMTATQSVTVAKVTSITVSPSEKDAKLSQLNNEAYKVFEPEPIYEPEHYGFLNLSTRNILTGYTIKYVEKQTISGDKKTSDAAKDADAIEAANTSAKAAAEASLNSKITSDMYVIENSKETSKVGTAKKDFTYNQTVTKQRDVTTYGYQLSYWDKQSEVSKDNTLIKTDVYGNAQVVKGVVNQNKNATEASALVVESKDSELQALVNNAKSLRDKYERLSGEADAANNAVKTANDKVVALRTVVDNLRKVEIIKNGEDKSQTLPEKKHHLTINELSKSVDIVDMNSDSIKSIIESLQNAGVDFGKEIESLTIDDIKAVLDAEQDKLDDLKGDLQKLVDSMDDVAGQLAATVARLTPAPASEGGSGSGSSSTPAAASVYVAAATPVAPMFTFPAATPADAAVAGARTGRRVAGNGAGDRIIEEDGAGIILPEETVDEITPVTEKKKVVTIEDNETPLAAVPVDEGQKMNWWWLLLIALLGATGEEMYRRNKNKKKEALASEIKNEADKQR